MFHDVMSASLLQISGETGAIIALVVALGIAGIAIILISTKKRN